MSRLGRISMQLAALSLAAVPVVMTLGHVADRGGRFSLALTLVAAGLSAFGIIGTSGSAMAVGSVLVVLVWAAAAQGVVAGQAVAMGLTLTASSVVASWGERSPAAPASGGLWTSRLATYALATGASVVAAVALSNMFTGGTASITTAFVGALAVFGAVAVVFLIAETGVRGRRFGDDVSDR
ncbi:MAG: hypothetical protein KDB16_04720 [Acidimicrobiales bacterium]|nr:hypothetical protein [Acidimicrobiales bacterium]